MSPSPSLKLPAELHSSAHQVRFDAALVGEYEVRIYRGLHGPVVVFEEASGSPLPLEYLSEHAVGRFLRDCPNSRARFFERHRGSEAEAWVEVEIKGAECFRSPCDPRRLADVFGSAPDRQRVSPVPV